MRFAVVVTSGGEVVFEGHSVQSREIYYGAPEETGLWRVSVPKFEEFMATELDSSFFGASIEKFVFGFEIAELDEWGRWFKETREYMSYRPKTKTFISVGQLEWKQVKDLDLQDQLILLGRALCNAIERIATAKRKPKDFDHVALLREVQAALARCNASVVSVEKNAA